METDIVRKLCVPLLCLALAVPILTGCSAKEHGHVTGVVKINGEPVEGATVFFAPKGGRSAFGRTGADGSYELEYTPGVMGAKVGVNAVWLSTYEESSLEDDGSVIDPGSPERFPPQYNENPSESVEVVPGENTFDFDVKASQKSYKRSSDS